MGAMTPRAAGRTSTNRLASIGLMLAAIGALAASANFFASMIPVDIGLAPDLEPMIVMLHGGSSVTAVGLVLVLLSRPRLVVPALRHPIVLLCFAVALWSALTAPLADYPLNALLGSPLLGEGALMYFEFGVLVAAAMAVRRLSVLAALLAGGTAAIGAAVPAIVTAGFARPEFFSEYVAFFALTSPALVIAAARRMPVRSAIALGLAAGLPALILSHNNSVWIASALGLLAAAVFAFPARWPRALANLDRRRLAGVLVPVVLVAVTLGVAFVGYEGLVRSLTSRLYLDRIALEALYDRPWSLLVGQGWGRTSEIILAHFNASGAVLWDGSWDATLRRYTHTHNLLFETALAAGLPALFGIVAMMTLVPVLARRGLLPVAAGFSIAFAALSAVWFQVAMTVPAVALAVGWLVRPARPPRALRRLTAVPAVWLAVVLACGMASLVAAIWLAKVGLAVRHGYFAENETAYSAPSCEALPLDLDRGSFTLAQSFSKAYVAAFADERAGRPVSEAHMARLDRLLCGVGRAAAVSHSADLLIMPVLFRSAIAFDLPLVQMRDRFSDTFPTWEHALDRFLAHAPKRTDIAWPYLSWLMERRDYGAVLAFCQRLLARDPGDPIGLWFAGSVYTRTDQPAVRQRGFDMLRRSLEGGIGRSMPIPPELKEAILNARVQP